MKLLPSTSTSCCRLRQCRHCRHQFYWHFALLNARAEYSFSVPERGRKLWVSSGPRKPGCIPVVGANDRTLSAGPPYTVPTITQQFTEFSDADYAVFARKLSKLCSLTSISARTYTIPAYSPSARTRRRFLLDIRLVTYDRVF